MFHKLFSATDRKGIGEAKYVLFQDKLPYFVSSVKCFCTLDLDDHPWLKREWMMAIVLLFCTKISLSCDHVSG